MHICAVHDEAPEPLGAPRPPRLALPERLRKRGCEEYDGKDRREALDRLTSGPLDARQVPRPRGGSRRQRQPDAGAG